MKIEERNGAVFLHIKVVPNSSRTAIAGILGDELKLKVAAPPEEGKANRAVEELLAKVIGVGKADVQIVAGASKSRKTVEIHGVTAEVVQAKIAAEIGATD